MHPPDASHLWQQIVWLFVLAIPISCISWTVTNEEVFREPREWCARRSNRCKKLIERKFFYQFTCEYCFSHYITILFLILTGYKLLLDDWRGYVLSFFALVWVSNAYMSLFSRLRVDIRAEQSEAKVKEKEATVKEKQIEKLETEVDAARSDGH